MHLAIAYLWITQVTYDKDYVATHTHGFDKFEEYVLGKEDGIPGTYYHDISFIIPFLGYF
jgi:anaerobic selenocysteine-containing dehydrogenase